MESVSPRLVKWLSISLLLLLLVLVGSLVKEVFFSKTADGKMTGLLFYFIIPIVGYFVTIRYCNKLMLKNYQQQGKSRFVFFLITATVGFVFSVITLIGLSFAVYETLAYDNDGLRINNFFDVILMLSIIIYALLGTVVFFMQLQIRKQLLSQKENSIEWLIDSIGTDMTNNEL